jgi:hypothetical protein
MLAIDPSRPALPMTLNKGPTVMPRDEIMAWCCMGTHELGDRGSAHLQVDTPRLPYRVLARWSVLRANAAINCIRLLRLQRHQAMRGTAVARLTAARSPPMMIGVQFASRPHLNSTNKNIHAVPLHIAIMLAVNRAADNISLSRERAFRMMPGRGLQGAVRLGGYVLETEPSVEAKMTRRREKWCVPGYRASQRY